MPLPHRNLLYYFVAGLIVAEGGFGKREHRNPGRFTFTNTDPELVKIVYYFLVKELGFPQDKIYIYITFNTEITSLSLDQIKEFWRELLGVDEKMIRVYPYHRRIKQIRRRSIYGICQIRVNDMELRKRVENFISSVLSNLRAVVGEGHIESP